MSYDSGAQGNISSRPTLRRKTSAGLLSSFKAPAAIGVGGGAVLPSSYPQLPPTPPISSPSPSSMAMGREWDSQSQFSESTAATATALVNSLAPAPAFQGTSIEYLRDMVQKRIVTLTYMRNTHEG